MSTCPYCAEEIQEAAVVCRHCGEAVVSDDCRAYSERYSRLGPKRAQADWAKLTPEQQGSLAATWKAQGYDDGSSPQSVPVSRGGLTGGGLLLGCLLLGIIISLGGYSLFLILAEAVAQGSSKRAAQAALVYLDQIPEVAWWEVDETDVYIAFRRVPDDLSAIVGGAARKGSKAINLEFHAWAVRASRAQRGWRPGDPGLLCEATARYGTVQKNSCRR